MCDLSLGLSAAFANPLAGQPLTAGAGGLHPVSHKVTRAVSLMFAGA